MFNQTKNAASKNSAGKRPQYRVWLVQDAPDGGTDWIELAGLWPTKSGKGFKGKLMNSLAVAGDRIVVLLANAKTAKEG
ncbi:MAG: hypothetical protein H6843_13960 [Rhodospirillaceae bacterium]|nr:hypothetical protein [Rhodospirillaceae bacterium]